MTYEDMTEEMKRALYEAVETFEEGPGSHDAMIHMVRSLKAAITPQVIATDAELDAVWLANYGNTTNAQRAIAADTWKRAAGEADATKDSVLAAKFRAYAAQALKGVK